MIIDEAKLKALIADYKKQHLELSTKPRRAQTFDHKERIARLEGQIFALSMVGALSESNHNIIEQ